MVTATEVTMLLKYQRGRVLLASTERKASRVTVEAIHSNGMSVVSLSGLSEVASARLRLVQIVFFQEFGPEILWRSGNVWPTLWRKVHEIPIRPHRV